uniref:X8 domain-containing protein n=1 Tax=Zea mays TaxID=4577 RepID=Q41871_MAIZE|nr:unknown protein [Zea mays]
MLRWLPTIGVGCSDSMLTLWTLEEHVFYFLPPLFPSHPRPILPSPASTASSVARSTPTRLLSPVLLHFTNPWWWRTPSVRRQATTECALKPNARDLGRLDANVDYACMFADCTSLGYNSTCVSMVVVGNTSYTFNASYQAPN